jgi:mRNA interferase YafO
MKVEVRFHPDTLSTMFTDAEKDFPGLLAKLLSDFKAYKEQDTLPNYFGRDAPYIQPPAALNARLMHLHLKPTGFPRNRPQLDRTSDISLVYTRGELEENQFCILAVFHPGAHAQARDTALMRYLARLAQEFREEH